MKPKIKLSEAFKKILGLLNLDKQDITAIYILSILAGFLSLSLPLGLQSIVGFLMGGELTASIIILVCLVLIGTFLNGFLQVRQLELIEKVEQKIYLRYALEIGDRIPKLNLSALDTYHLPSLVNYFFDLPILQKSIQKLLVDIPPAIIQIVFGIVLLSFYHPLFIAFGIFLTIIVYLILRFTASVGFQTSFDASNYKHELASWFQELARNNNVFKFGRNTRLNIKGTDVITTKYLNTKTNHFRILKIQYWSLIVFKLLITAAMLIFGLTLLLSQRINIGQFIAADIVILAIINSAEKIIGSLDLVYEALTSVEKLNKLINSEIEKGGTLVPKENGNGFKITCENLSYSTHEGVTLLNNVNFHLESGQWLNAYGPSGAGKTILVKLLTGIYPNSTGKILIDGIPLKNYDLSWYRSKIGFLQEHKAIFQGTLLSNITLDNTYSIDQIKQVCNITGLHAFIENFELGLDTYLEQEGRKLSSLTRHQILLTRTLILKSNIYFLEEPFSFLHKINKEKVLNYLKESGATVIITGFDPLNDYDVVNLNLS
ncbi:MAG: peptidase domain-containing ABC transporter [Leadbetterella sp.]